MTLGLAATEKLPLNVKDLEALEALDVMISLQFIVSDWVAWVNVTHPLVVCASKLIVVPMAGMVSEHGSATVGASMVRSNEALTPATELIDLSVILHEMASDEMVPTPETSPVHVVLVLGLLENVTVPEMVVVLTMEPVNSTVGHLSLVIDLSSESICESTEVAEILWPTLVSVACAGAAATPSTASAARAARAARLRMNNAFMDSAFLSSMEEWQVRYEEPSVKLLTMAPPFE